MDRRTFIGTTTAAIASTALPLQAKTETVYDKILQSFPKLGDNEMGFLVVQRENDQFGIQNVTVQSNSWIRNESFEGFVKKRFVQMDYKKASKDNKHIEAIFNMNRASNDIAACSRLGCGRKYAVLDNDTVLVWYKGIKDYDTPVCTNGNSFYFNPNYSDYFRKIKGIKLTDSDHKTLKTIGYERID